MQAKSKRSEISSVERKKITNLEFLYLVKLFFRNEEDMKTISDTQILKEFVTNRPALQEMLKEVL